MRVRSILLASIIAIPAASTLGGWAVVTVENPPERLVVGAPYTLEYTVRQHGKDLLNDLDGKIEARSGGNVARADAKRIANGKYAGTVAVPSAGSWTITVNSGFGKSMTTMRPLLAVAAGAPVVVMSDAERGEHLFAAKGCVTCHVEMKVIPTDVRANKYDEKFVKQLLTDPSAMPRRHKAGVDMPNLNLKPAEIGALAAYLAGPNSTGTR
jgi:hypothetical protein